MPLIVSEILIETQQMRQEQHCDREENHRLLLMEENRKNTEQMLQVFNRGFDILHTRINQVDEQLERVEGK